LYCAKDRDRADPQTLSPNLKKGSQVECGWNKKGPQRGHRSAKGVEMK